MATLILKSKDPSESIEAETVKKNTKLSRYINIVSRHFQIFTVKNIRTF